VPLKVLPGRLQRGINGFVDGMQLEMKFKLVGVELCDLGSLAHQSIEAIALLVDHRQQLLTLRRLDLRIR